LHFQTSFAASATGIWSGFSHRGADPAFEAGFPVSWAISADILAKADRLR
jgi:hypothetical protein